MEKTLEVSTSNRLPVDNKLSGSIQDNRQSGLGALPDSLRNILQFNPQIQIQMKTLVGLLAISLCMQMSAQVMVKSEPQKSDIILSVQDTGYSPEVIEITALPTVDQTFIVEDSAPALAVVESTAIDATHRPFVLINGDTFYLDDPALADGIHLQYNVEQPLSDTFIDRVPVIKPPQSSEIRSIGNLKTHLRPVEPPIKTAQREVEHSAPDQPDWPAVAVTSLSTVIWALTPLFKG